MVAADRASCQATPVRPRPPSGQVRPGGPADWYPLPDLRDRLLAETLGEGAEDDVAVLAVRVHPETWQRPEDAGPEHVPPAARRT